MTWIRTRATVRDNVGAGLAAFALAAGVGAATFYLVRVLLAREPLDLPQSRHGSAVQRDREGAGA
ncbi:MAG: hypothetical protein PVJ02_05395 [Gemmatimonadota bacterium]|jgi:hypothetical protein